MHLNLGVAGPGVRGKTKDVVGPDCVHTSLSLWHQLELVYGQWKNRDRKNLQQRAVFVEMSMSQPHRIGSTGSRAQKVGAAQHLRDVPCRCQRLLL